MSRPPSRRSELALALLIEVLADRLVQVLLALLVLITVTVMGAPSRAEGSSADLPSLQPPSAAILERAKRLGAQPQIRTGSDASDLMHRLKALSRSADRHQAAQAAAERIAPTPIPPSRQSGALNPHRASNLGGPGQTTRYVVFISESMGRGRIGEIGRLANARGDMTLVLRGIGEGETVSGFANRVLGGELPTSAEIDPRPFAVHGIEQVPALLDQETGLVAFGTANPDVLASVNNRETVGPLFDIAEVDLRDEIARRVAEVDWGAQRRGALDRFWEGRPHHGLTPAREDRVRRISVAMRLAEDFRLPDGTLGHPAGTVVNPTRLMPITETMVVLDARRAEEVAYVEEIASRLGPAIVMLSDLDRPQGWEVLADLRTRLGQQVYLLPEILAERFQLHHTPSFIRTVPGHIEVREVFLEEEPA
ncbi:MAG: TrbC family F-type conjugative pilus assembly protein [Pseudomonadota bacterium]